jgi:outer membrane protein OmpA-like peptidoglycan-associated protein
MSSRVLVLTVFVVWSILCCYWYVCGIKQQCGDRPTQAQQAISFEPDLLTQNKIDTYQPDTLTTPTAPPSDLTPSTPTTPPPVSTDPDLTRVKVDELADHVRIHFPYNSTRKVDDADIDAYLTRLAQQLVSSGGSVTLTGHTDNVGDNKTNNAFAMRRAKNIRDILIAKGVSKRQITCKSFGENKPIATNDNPQGRYKNRRVEIRVNQ